MNTNRTKEMKANIKIKYYHDVVIVRNEVDQI